MVTLYQNKIQEQLHMMMKMANANTSFISVSEKTDSIDPLRFFHLGEEFSLGHRFFWSDSANEAVYVGLGCTYSIEVSHYENRFMEVEHEWKRFIEQVLFDQKGRGPLLFGGFSFDPLKPKTRRWVNFPEAKMIIPMMLLSVVKGESSITITIPTKNNKEELRRIEQILTLLQQEKVASYEHYATCVKFLEIEKDEWMAAVAKATSDIQSGELGKVVLAREARLSFDQRINSAVVLHRLREQQPYSYVFAFENGNDCFLGASPEQLVKKEGDVCYSTCLAGSIKRGRTLNEDEKLGNWLLQDKKNLHEHQFVVDMIRTAMMEVCDEVVIPNKPSLLKMRDIQHLYTPVKGFSHQPISLLSLVERLHPTPALGGTPRDKALKKIREIEPLDRGWYAAPIGWIDANGNGEFAVAIRSGLLQGKEASIFAGCGVVGDSDPISEYEETRVKFKPMLSALGGEGYE
ncbi:isochorismate synthase [Bacillus alveayuensis]|uniref:isochorismate synthase n=1 Tax=Aeribacillus alveayuensis TaxID=279215 RepID=UPI000A76FE25|nr:isochorismate synthase [Bacillus alveayuensis]